ncbi:OmpA family protein [Sneathiella sp. CAU 1612]|uniref:OmpA family protein n=1 Tax=Sneathiella sedimenti TaxID=2816034 RepID=A0ABS3F847_9PROT|nr:flagellar motor protein MotB [Sneathiella sedimenti]MBO0334695.1 OmpA family protein [Sneathiella sedimenti]
MTFFGLQYEKSADTSTAWMTSLADLLALLLAFFVLLFSMSEIKVDRWQTLTETFGNKMSDVTDLVTKTGEAEKNMSMINEPKAIDLSYLEHVLNGKKQQSELLANVDIFRAEDRLVISLAGWEFFKPGTEKESGEVAEVIGMIGNALRHISNRIEVYGHTDPDPITSATAKYPNNWALSLARALSVANELENSGYIYPIRVYGMADSRFNELIYVDDKDRKYALARRVDIVVREAEGRGK